MADEPENHTLAFLRRLDAKLDRVIATQHEHGGRLSHIDGALAGLRRDQGSDAEVVALLQARVDHLQTEIDRINRRLGLLE